MLATETGAAGPAAVRAAITADRANLAALRADRSAAASIAAAQAQLARDRARRAADRGKLAATEIVAPASGTVVAIDGQPGELVSPAGLSSSAARAPASPRPQQAPPVITLRTGGGWQVRLLIPRADRSAAKVGGTATISVPAAQVSGVEGTITQVSAAPASSSGPAAYEAVVQVIGQTLVAPHNGLTANVQLGSLRLRGRAG